MLVRVIREPDPVVINIFTIPDPELVLKALLEAHEIFQTFYTRPSKVCYFLMIKSYYFLLKGFLIQKKEVCPVVGGASSDLPTPSNEVIT